MLILLVFGVRGCLDARKERALKDYVRDVGALVQESDQESEALFDLLRDPGDASEVDIENQLNTFRNQAEPARGPRRRAPTTRATSTPRTRYLVETLEFRRDGVRPDRRAAAQRDRRPGRPQRRPRGRSPPRCRTSSTSDVIYQTRFTPRLEHRAEGCRTSPRRSRASSFLPDIELAPARRGGRPRAQPGRHRRRRRRRARPARQRARRASRSAARRSTRRLGERSPRPTTWRSRSRWPTRARTPRPT